MRTHVQNLSEGEDGKPTRHLFWNGRARAWLDDGGQSLSPHVEWSHGLRGSGWFALEVNFDRDEREVQVHVALPGLRWWVSVDQIRARWFDGLPWSFRRTDYKYMGGNRSVGFRTHGWALWASLWEDRDDWRSSDPWWQRGRLGWDDVFDALLGKTEYSTRVLEEREIEIPMPEKTYKATATRELAQWVRRRWPWAPFSKRRTRVDVKIPEGIGMPGKGENSWDCGDDATYGLSTPARTIEEAIGKVVESVFRTRLKRGGSHRFAPSTEVVQ